MAGWQIDWNALSAIGSLLGAAGTVAATIVALHLARSANRPQLSVEGVMGLEFRSGQKRDWIIVEVANTGSRSERITAIWFRARGSKHRLLFELARDEGDQLPCSVPPGENFNFRFNPLEFAKDIAGGQEWLRGPFGGARRMIAGVQTASNFTAAALVSPALQEFFDRPEAALLLSEFDEADFPAREAWIARGSGLLTSRRKRRR